ncbi:hypothetical protein BDR26DRAFT_890305 [Obelidium mucronatum]|nr:hypothetical protein BDR26DRAFT_890305 [Obelidium mucronatum]
MQYSAAQLAFGAISIAFFPAAWVLVHFMMVHKEWCFADFCVESMGSRRVPVRNTLVVYYCFLGFSALVALAAKSSAVVKRVVGLKIHPRYTVTVGEVAWFSMALLLSLIIVPAMIWNPYWNMWVSMLKSMSSGKMNMGAGMQMQSWPWIRIVYETMTLTTGDSLALLLGLVILPVSKNTFLGTFLDLPYTSTVRMHMWLGYAIFWMTVVHLLVCMFAKALDTTPLYELFFTVPADTPWGNLKYIYLMGMIAFFFLGFVTFTSLSYFRRKHYNFFYVTHFLVLIVVVFAYLHASMDIFYMIPGLCMYAVDGFIRLYSLQSKETVESVIFEESGYITVTVATKQGASARPGQFMRVNVPSVSTFEFHPWSIVKSTPDSVSFVFQRSFQDKEWSSLVADKLKADSNLAVHLQGPFGKEIDVAADNSLNSVVFYVAGTGIAASVAAIKQVMERNAAASGPPTKIYLFWSSRKSGMQTLSWFQNSINDTKHVTVELFQTCDDEVPSADHVMSHRPNLKQLLNKYISPLVSESGVVSCGVFVCGPETFVRDALESASAFQNSRKEVKLTVEVESYDL